ncbi:MAG: tRNA (5-methylaminomethyl-2-thiouridine)(34)-methyltransferase MnmD [Bacteroidia bacterium]|nr:tRNA (5-methylaminomethyl-2-thiouridine)(34)-methyltransferase MnmD [Bacteroidia bacterium]
MMEVELLYTADGSHTVLNKELNVTYHSIRGAIQESKHVYIEAGFKYVAQKFKALYILEIGFGTGLNALLSVNESQEMGIPVSYETIEKFPLSGEITRSLNYSGFDRHGIMEKLHNSDWDRTHIIEGSFVFRKLLMDINDFKAGEKIHLVYYDAFAPDSAPEMWTERIFEMLFKSMVAGGCLVTFCAKGDIKRMLKTCGFKVESLVGFAGKREMIRAIRL